MSPSEPSVSAGQKTGMSFCNVLQPLSYTAKTDIHFIRPIIYRFFVIDLFSESPYERARGPHFACLFLFGQHGVKNRGEPVLEFAVIIIRDNEVADSVHTSLS